MKNMRVFRFLKNLGLISRLMIAVGVAIVAGGGVQTVLLVAEGAAEHSARLLREQKETLLFLAHRARLAGSARRTGVVRAPCPH